MIILDARSAEGNAPTTSLPHRIIVDRTAYKAGTLCFGENETEYLLISANNSRIAWSNGYTKTYTISKISSTPDDDGYYTYEINTYDAVKGISTLIPDTYFKYPNKVVSLSDALTEIDCEIEEPKFWWTRNDTYKKRFEYKGVKWELLKGDSVSKVDSVKEGLIKVPKGVVGNLNDVIKIIRIGNDLDDASAFKTTLVVQSINEYTDDWSMYDSLYGLDDFAIKLNDSILSSDLGQAVWFYNMTLGISTTGIINIYNTVYNISNIYYYSSYYINPVLKEYEVPLLKLSQQRYLDVYFIDSVLDLPVSIDSLSAYVIKATGQVFVYNPNKLYLIFDGVVLTSRPISFIGGISLNESLSNVPYKSISQAGVDRIDDGSGLDNGDPTGVRPSGTGYVTGLENRYNFIVSEWGHVIRVSKVNYPSRIPNRIKKYRGYLSLVPSSDLFTITINPSTKELLSGYDLKFVQTTVPLKSWCASPILYSNIPEPFNITQNGTLSVTIDSTTHNISMTKGDDQAISDLFTNISGITSENGYIKISGGSEVSILNTSDVSILQDLGLVPNTISGSGYAYNTGLMIELDRRNKKGAYDFYETVLLDSETVSDKLTASPSLSIDFKPRIDFKGYGTNKFFRVGSRSLVPDEDVKYYFEENRITFIKKNSTVSKIIEPSSVLSLTPGVLPNTTSITVSQGGIKQVLVEGTDFDVNTNAGTARLFTKLGGLIDEGYRATILGSKYTLESPSSVIQENDWIYSNQQFFKVLNVDNDELTLSGTATDTSWKAYKGYDEPNHTLLNDECFISLDNTRDFVTVYKLHKVVNTVRELLPKTKTPKIKARLQDHTEIDITILSPVYVGIASETLYVDITDPRVMEYSYQLKVGANLLYVNTGFTIGIDGQITFVATVDETDEVYYIPLPMNDPTTVEISLIDDSETYLNSEKPTYLTEEVPTSEYVIQPSDGGISFLKPLDAGIYVEVSYFPNEYNFTFVGGENPTYETILFSVNKEVATATVDPLIYTFNSNDYETDSSITPSVFVGSSLLGFGGSATASVDFTAKTITLPALPDLDPDGNYVPIYITYSIKQTVGGERTCRTSDPMFVPLYQVLKDSTTLKVYGNCTDVVSVGSVIYVPNLIFKVASVSYGLYTNITTITFTSGASDNCGAKANNETTALGVLSNNNIFVSLSTLSGITHTIDAKPKSTEIVINGDLRDVLNKGSLIYVNSADYYRVDTVELTEDKTKSIVTITDKLKPYNVITSVLVSVRPVYTEGETTLFGKGPYLTDYDAKVIRYTNGVGKELTKGVDYTIVEATGEVRLLTYSVQPNVSYYFLHRRLSLLYPRFIDGVLTFPTYKAVYVNVIACPYENKQLLVKAVIQEPDQFAVRVVSETAYEGEISSELVPGNTSGRRTKSTTKSGRSLGLYDGLAKDIIARNKLLFYHSLVNILENLSGHLVGDQDGQLKYDLDYADYNVAEGVVDNLTGVLKNRYVALELLRSSTNLGLVYSDPMVSSGSIDGDGYVNGTALDIDQIAAIANDQKALINNQIDDIVLYSYRVSRRLAFLTIIETVYPKWRPLWLDSSYSRIYPEQTMSAYFLANGTLKNKNKGRVVGTVSNSEYEEIGGITSIDIEKRPARFRVWDYSKTGFSGKPTEPTLILSAVPLKEFPLDIDGNPDVNKFISSGGSIPDVSLGNPDRRYKGLTKGSALLHGTYDGGFSTIVNTTDFASVDFTIANRVARVVDVIDGCYVVLSSGALESFDTTFNPQRGDTIVENFSGDIDDTAPSNPSYRPGFDIGVNNKTGELYDNTYPSFSDPNFPIKELLEQNPPSGGSCLGGIVRFNNTLTSPFNSPALRGEDLNDSGDESIPFRQVEDELSVISGLGTSIVAMLQKQTLGQYVYPDEIRGVGVNTDGVITTTADLTPSGIATKSASVGDLIVIADKGLHEISAINGNEITLPRFRSDIPVGNKIKYRIGNLIGYDASPLYANGVVIQEDISYSPYPTIDYVVTSITFHFDFENSDIYNTLATLPGIQYRELVIKFVDTSGNYLPSTNNLTIIKSAGWSLKCNGVTRVATLEGIIGNTIYFRTSSTIFNWSGITYTQLIPFVERRSAVYSYAVDLDLSTYGSTLASIGTDRVSLDLGESYDSIYMQPRGTKILGNANIEAGLYVYNCEITLEDGNEYESTINHISQINKDSQTNEGVPFTNLVVDGNTIIVPSYEGNGNVELGTDLDFSIMLGAEVDESAVIYNEKAKVGAYNDPSKNNVLHSPSGSFSSVKGGDLVKIRDGYASGVYRVSAVVDTSVITTATALWCPFFFPRVFDITIVSNTVTITTDYDASSLFTTGFYILVSSSPTGALSEIYSFTGTISSTTITSQNSDWKDHFDNSVLTDEQILAIKGKYILGIKKVPVSLGKYGFDSEFDFKIVGQKIVDSIAGDIATTSDTYLKSVGYIQLDTGLGTNLFGATNKYPLMLNSVLSLELPIGLYIDGSFPRTSNDLKVVNDFNTTSKGIIPFSELGLDPVTAPPTGTSQEANIVVYRPRRFSPVFKTLSQDFSKLRFYYELRKGLVNSISNTGTTFSLTAKKVNYKVALDVNGTDTQIGNFSEVLNIGDKVYVYDNQDRETHVLRVTEVNDLTFKASLIRYNKDYTPYRFEIFKYSPNIVPIEQSLKQFIDLCFDVVLENSGASVVTENELTDGGATFTSDVLAGDYLVIDPQGVLPGTTDEYGAPPRGWYGVLADTPENENPLDDNRGVYKVVEITNTTLTVEPVVGTVGINPSSQLFILPPQDIAGDEAEATKLRLTAPAINGSFNDPSRDDTKSIEPFTYKVLRVKSGVAIDLAEDILFLRERLLSFVEKMKAVTRLKKSSWDKYELEEQYQYAGVNDFTHPTNETLVNIVGRTKSLYPSDVSIGNTSECLSLLERRYMLEDRKLIEEDYIDSNILGMYTIVEDRIDEYELREERYDWLNIRCNLISGSLVTMRRSK
jgi:hypothetical protein